MSKYIEKSDILKAFLNLGNATTTQFQEEVLFPI